MQPEAPTVTVRFKRADLKRLREFKDSYNQLIELCREQVELDIQRAALKARLDEAADLFHGTDHHRWNYEQQEEIKPQEHLERLLNEWAEEDPDDGTATYALQDGCLMLDGLAIEVRIKSDDRRIAGKRVIGDTALIDLNTGLAVLSYDDEPYADNGFNFAITVDPSGRVEQAVRMEGPEDSTSTQLAHDLYDDLHEESK